MDIFVMKRNRLKSFIIAAVLILCCGSVAQLYASQNGTVGSQTPVGQSATPQMTQAIYIVHGTITASDGSKIKGVEVSLVQVFTTSNPKGRAAAQVDRHTTDDAGNYAFGIPSANKGKTYKIVPKYSTYPSGNFFTPANRSFTFNGSVTLNFTFDSPHVKITGVAKRPFGRKMPGMEIQLFEVHGPHQFKYLGSKTTDSAGSYKFELDHYGNFGNSFMMRARHPQNQIIGQGFTPNETTVALNGDVVVDFVYDGPLPDLVVSNVQYIKDSFDPEYIIFTVTNQGERAAGACQAELSYNTYHYSTKENPLSTTTRSIPALGPGASHTMQFWFPMFEDTKNSVSRFFVDRYDEVIEKDESNNYYPKNQN